MSKTDKIYFTNLTALRFFAAFSVMLAHLESMKNYHSISNFASLYTYRLGAYGVDFFFVLSGFLITYLLIYEKEKLSHINRKKFYMRRILRIFPLYYLVLIISFFILPSLDAFYVPKLTENLEKSFTENLILNAALLPNVASSTLDTIPYFSMAWSIGVEEQFYLIWPLLFIFKKRKHLFLAMIALFSVMILLKASALIFNFPTNVKEFLSAFKIEIMCIGGIGAYILYYDMSLLNKAWMRSKLMLTAAITSVIAILLFLPLAIDDISHVIIAALFLIIILRSALINLPITSMLGKGLDYLGKISYGLYMYHLICMGLTIHLLRFTNIPAGTLQWNCLYYAMSIFLSILISALSYEFYEKKFIRMKTQYQQVKSQS